jgi:hypothetical protein
MLTQSSAPGTQIEDEREGGSLFTILAVKVTEFTALSSPQLRGAASAVEATRDGIEPLLWNAWLAYPPTPFAASTGGAAVPDVVYLHGSEIERR